MIQARHAEESGQTASTCLTTQKWVSSSPLAPRQCQISIISIFEMASLHPGRLEGRSPCDQVTKQPAGSLCHPAFVLGSSLSHQQQRGVAVKANVRGLLSGLANRPSLNKTDRDFENCVVLSRE